MGIAIHRHSDDRSCGATTVVSNQSTVTADGLLVSVEPDQNSHGGGALTSQANGVFIEGKLVIRDGDPGAADPIPGHVSTPASSGSGTVFVGFPTARALSPTTIAFEIEDQPTQTPITDQPDRAESNTPGGGAIAPRVDGGPFVNAGVVFTPGEPSLCTRTDIGTLSERYESNGDPAAIGRDRTGGYSYGTYQIATKVGTMNSFLSYMNQYPDMYSQLQSAGGNAGATSGTTAFKNTWISLAADPQFKQAQHDFIQVTHYDKLVKKIKNDTGIDICDGTHCNGLQDAVWSISVQHGPGSRIPTLGISNAGGSPTDDDIINAIFDERDNVNKYFASSTAKVKQSVANRFTYERQGALQMCGI